MRLQPLRDDLASCHADGFSAADGLSLGF